MDTEIIVNTPQIVPVRLLGNSTFTPITGVTSPTVYLHKYGAGTSTISKAISTSNWTEIDKINFPGVYDLLLSSTDTNTSGILKVSVKAANSDWFIGTYSIVPTNIFSIANNLQLLRQMSVNKTQINGTSATFSLYDDTGTNVIISYKLYDDGGNLSTANIFERVPNPFAMDASITSVSSGNCVLTSNTLNFSIITTSNQAYIVAAQNSANKGQFPITNVASNSLTFTNTNGIVDTSGAIVINII